MADDVRQLNEAYGDIDPREPGRGIPMSDEFQVGKASSTVGPSRSSIPGHYKNVRLSDEQIDQIIGCIMRGHQNAGYNNEQAYALVELLTNA